MEHGNPADKAIEGGHLTSPMVDASAQTVPFPFLPELSCAHIFGNLKEGDIRLLWPSVENGEAG